MEKKEQPQEGLTEELTLLYCKWCPKDCKGLTKAERIGCLAAGGFVDDFVKLNYSSPQEVKEQAKQARTFAKCSNCGEPVLMEVDGLSIILKCRCATASLEARYNPNNRWKALKGDS